LKNKEGINHYSVFSMVKSINTAYKWDWNDFVPRTRQNHSAWFYSFTRY